MFVFKTAKELREELERMKERAEKDKKGGRRQMDRNFAAGESSAFGYAIEFAEALERSEYERMTVNERNLAAGLPAFDSFETAEYIVVAVYQTPTGSGIVPEPTEYLFTGVGGKEKASAALKALEEAGSCVSLRMYRRSLEAWS